MMFGPSARWLKSPLLRVGQGVHDGGVVNLAPSDRAGIARRIRLTLNRWTAWATKGLRMWRGLAKMGDIRLERFKKG
jgi:hypothetical protein